MFDGTVLGKGRNRNSETWLETYPVSVCITYMRERERDAKIKNMDIIIECVEDDVAWDRLG